jgi:uncharacterized protein YyaL (SSP411 family)
LSASSNTLVAVSLSGGNGRPLFEGRTAPEGEALAYICRNSVCQLPASTTDGLLVQLK